MGWSGTTTWRQRQRRQDDAWTNLGCEVPIIAEPMMGRMGRTDYGSPDREHISWNVGYAPETGATVSAGAGRRFQCELAQCELGPSGTPSGRTSAAISPFG